VTAGDFLEHAGGDSRLGRENAQRPTISSPRAVARRETAERPGTAAADPVCISLANSYLKLEVAPELGGGITRFDWCGKDGDEPLFRRTPRPAARLDPNELACYPLVPFSNRIGHGRFSFDGREYHITPNRAGEAYPIHGDGWLTRWRVESVDDDYIKLVVDKDDGTPYTYRASITYVLSGATLVMRLEVENTGRDPLPFGLGVHPFLVRDGSTALSAEAGGVWLAGPDWLPVRHVTTPAAWQLGVAYSLPDALVNNAFTDWSGGASIIWAQRKLVLHISADCDFYVLYTPTGKDYFCFEPVDHPVNAVNLPGGPQSHGMTVLAEGERLMRSFGFSAERIDRRVLRRGI
jgi:aldose 1-epimerase